MPGTFGGGGIEVFAGTVIDVGDGAGVGVGEGIGVADVTVFSDVQEIHGEVLFREGWLLVKGKVQRRGPKALSIIAEELSPIGVVAATT